MPLFNAILLSDVIKLIQGKKRTVGKLNNLMRRYFCVSHLSLKKSRHIVVLGRDIFATAL
jgi:hypothetical protein